MKAGIGLVLTKEAKVLLTREAITTDRHCVFKTPNLDVFIDLTQAISAAEKSGTNCCTNRSTMSINTGCSTDVGLVIPDKL